MADAFGNDRRRSGGRQKKELEIEIRVAGGSTGKAYSLDLSPGGFRVAGVGLRLALSEQINFSFAASGEKYGGEGIVSRKDGLQGIMRIGGRLGNAFFIKVNEQKYREFLEMKFNIKPGTTSD
jgi:hypothetical protein